MQSGYAITTEGEISLPSAGNTKTILAIRGGTQFGVVLKGFWLDFDGVTSSDKPVKLIIGACTFATAGTPDGTAPTVRQVYGRVAGTGFTANRGYTAEPTVVASIDEFSLDPNKGLFRYDWPLGEAPDSPLNEGFVLQARVETGDTVTAAIRAGMRFHRV